MADDVPLCCECGGEMEAVARIEPMPDKQCGHYERELHHPWIRCQVTAAVEFIGVEDRRIYKLCAYHAQGFDGDDRLERKS